MLYAPNFGKPGWGQRKAVYHKNDSFIDSPVYTVFNSQKDSPLREGEQEGVIVDNDSYQNFL